MLRDIFSRIRNLPKSILPKIAARIRAILGSLPPPPQDPPPQDPPGMALASFTCRDIRVGRNLIRTVIPVPDNWTEVPLHIVDSLGNSWPTQQRASVRGPNDNARTLRLEAAYDSTSTGIKTFTVEAGAALSSETIPDNIVVTMKAEDHNNTTYQAALMTAEACPVSGGEVTKTFFRRGEMRSSGNARFLGFDAEITKVAGEPGIFLVNMRLQNGTVGAAEILHDLFFNEVRLEMPAGYQLTHMIPTPYTTSTKLMKPMSDGTLHVVKMGDMKDYRFAIHTAATAARAAQLLALSGFGVCNFSKTEWAWDNPNTAWYGPQAVMALEHNLNGWLPYTASFSTVASALLNGSSITVESWATNPLGPYHTRGETSGAGTGGVGITAFSGYDVLNQGTVSSLKNLMAMQMMDIDRQRGVCLVGTDQLGIDCGDWDLSGIQFVQMGKFNVNWDGPFPRPFADQWRLNEVTQAGKLPWYYDQLGNFQPYDYAHIVRGAGPSMALAWLFDDYLAKSYFANLAPWCRMRMLEYGFGDAIDAYNKSQSNPGKGGAGGRIQGWSEWTICADYLLTSDDDKRTNYEPWFTMMVNARVDGQLPSGFWHDEQFGKPATDTNNSCGLTLSNGYAVGQAIEHGIELTHGLRSIYVITQDSRIPQLITNACAGLWNYHWQVGGSAPHFTIAVRPGDISLPAYTQQSDTPACAKINGTDNYQIGMVPALALMVSTNDANAWNIIASLTGSSDPATAVANLQAQMPFKMAEGWGPLLAFLMNYTSAEAVHTGGTSLGEQVSTVLSSLPPAQQEVLSATIQSGLGRLNR